MPTNINEDKQEQKFEEPELNEGFTEEYATYVRKFIRGCLIDLSERGYSPESAVKFMTSAPVPSTLGHLTWSCAEACTFLHFKSQYQIYCVGFSDHF